MIGTHIHFKFIKMKKKKEKKFPLLMGFIIILVISFAFIYLFFSKLSIDKAIIFSLLLLYIDCILFFVLMTMAARKGYFDKKEKEKIFLNINFISKN